MAALGAVGEAKSEPRERQPLLAMLSRVGVQGCFATT
jgi:hypothetical protein